jgi:hypothetical protein
VRRADSQTVQTPPYRYLLRGAAVGATLAAVFVALIGFGARATDVASARALAHVDGTGASPIKVKVRLRPPVDAGQPNDPLWAESWSLAKVHAPGA